MFDFIKKKAVSAAINSFMIKFATINELYKNGQLSEYQYQKKKSELTCKYQAYLRETPKELLPDCAKKF